MKTIKNKSLLGGGGNPLLKCAVKAAENDSAVCGSHLSKEITTSYSASAPRNDSTETREIITSEPVALPRNDSRVSVVIARERSDRGNLIVRVVDVIKNHWCNRVIYTPAEAAPLLNDDNNMVTITFKK